MPVEPEYVFVQECPLCNHSHQFPIQIEFAIAVGMVDTIQPLYSEQKYFTLLFTCPSRNLTFSYRFSLMESPNKKIAGVTVLPLDDKTVGRFKEKELPHSFLASSLSPHNQAIYEAGKALLNDSISTTHKFCESMITISLSAIPIYLGLLSLFLPKSSPLNLIHGIVAILPVVLFLLSTIIFVFGFMPVQVVFSLDVIEKIEDARNQIIRRRTNVSKVGFSVFIVGVCSATIISLMMLGL